MIWAVFYVAEGEEADDGGDEAEDSGGEMEGVSVGDDVEGVTAAAGDFEGRALKGELMPGQHLADEEEGAEDQRVAKSQGRVRREVGLPRPNHSSMASIWWNMWRRANSTVMELRRRARVLSHRMGGRTVGSQALT